MLQGSLTFRDEHIGEVTYEVYAIDTFEETKMYLMNTPNNYTNYVNAALLYDKEVKEDGSIHNPYEDSYPSDNRRLDIKRKNKYKSNITNRDFCVKISALVRYMQENGKKNYNTNIGEDAEFSSSRKVLVDDLGYIKYDTGLMTELECANRFVKLSLRIVEGDLEQEGIFKTLKQKDKYDNILSVTPIENVGFRLCEETLGFHYKPLVRKDPPNLIGMYDNIEDVIANNPEKNTSWILGRDYRIVSDAELEDVIKDFMDYDGYIAFDTETTGLNINFKSRAGEAAQLVGCVLSKEKGTGYYFPLQHKLFDNLCGGDHWYFMERYMKPILEKKKIICHNLQYDWKVAYIYDINVNCVYDTLLAFGVTKRYEDETFKLGLKHLAKNILGLDMFDLNDFVIGTSFSDSDITFADLPYELVRRYAPADADMTLTLFEYLEKNEILARYEAYTVFDIEITFSKAVAYSEFYGYHLNIDKIPELKEQIVGNMEKYKQEMFKIAGKEFNPNSPKQLMSIMYDELNIEQIGPKRSTDKETLKALSQYIDAGGNPKYPFVVALKKYRDNEGIYKNFLKRLHEFSTPDGYIFPEVKQLGTNTGRCSVNKPNYQSYNDPVKENVSPRPGYIHVDCDFAQIEYRVLASMAGQETLIDAFNDPDLDYHTYQASRMFGVPYTAVTKSLRQQSKGVNFGLPYGMGDSSLGTRIYGERNEENTRKAAILRKKFFQGQEKIEVLFETVRSEGVTKGYTKTKFGRRRYYHKAVFSVPEIRRQAGNHVIQGTAADIYKLAVNNMFKRVIAEGWLGKVLFDVFVHDELLMEVHESINPYYFFKAWREEFQVAIEGFCTLYAGLGVGKCWYDAKKLDLPPQYTDILINKWNDDMEWDGDFDKLLVDIKQGFEDYKVNRVREYILDTKSQGEVISPTINSLLVEVTENIIKELQTTRVSEIAGYNALFDSPLISVEGRVKIKNMQDNLKIFCKYYDIDYSKIDILAMDTTIVNNNTNNTEEKEVEFEDDTFSLEDLIRFRGYYEDFDNGIIYLTERRMVYRGIDTDTITFLNKGMKIFMVEGKYKIGFLNENTNELIVYNNVFTDEDGRRMIVRTYNRLHEVNMSYRRIM